MDLETVKRAKVAIGTSLQEFAVGVARFSRDLHRPVDDGLGGARCATCWGMPEWPCDRWVEADEHLHEVAASR